MKKQKQFQFKKVSGWGGKRKNAGRKNRSKTVSHMKRDQVDFKKPLMITMKLKRGLYGLRHRQILKRFEECGRKVKPFGLHILHFSIESNHLHMTAEAKDNRSLGNGMRSLGGRLGKVIRRMFGGRGSVFAGRYHLRVLKTPSQTRNAMAYVLLNQSKHEKVKPYVDHFSSAKYFGQWKALLGWKIGPNLRDYEPEPIPEHLAAPRSWLAREGWRKAV